MKRLLCTTALSMIVAGGASTAFAQSAEYCPESWASADTNADGVVSADERQAADAGIHSGFDADGDGIVSRDEYIDCVGSRTGERAPGDEATFMSADVDGDGMISAEEYRMAAQGAYQLSIETGDAASAGTEVWMGSTDAAGSAEMSEEQAGARASMHFRSFDGDGDGQISREEWTGVGDDENAGAGAQGAYFDSMDEDMDGQVTVEEFSAARGSAYDAALSASEAEGVDTSTGVPPYTYRFYVN